MPDTNCALSSREISYQQRTQSALARSRSILTALNSSNLAFNFGTSSNLCSNSCFSSCNAKRFSASSSVLCVSGLHYSCSYHFR